MHTNTSAKVYAYKAHTNSTQNTHSHSTPTNTQTHTKQKTDNRHRHWSTSEEHWKAQKTTNTRSYHSNSMPLVVLPHSLARGDTIIQSELNDENQTDKTPTNLSEAIIHIRLPLSNIHIATACKLTESIMLAVDKSTVVCAAFMLALHNLVRPTAMWCTVTVHCTRIISGVRSSIQPRDIDVDALLHHGGSHAIWSRESESVIVWASVWSQTSSVAISTWWCLTRIGASWHHFTYIHNKNDVNSDGAINRLTRNAWWCWWFTGTLVRGHEHSSQEE